MNILVDKLLYDNDLIQLDHKPRIIKRSYPIARTNIKPSDNIDKFYLLEKKLKDHNVVIHYLNSGVSIKIKTGKIYRNIFCLRHPKINNGILSFNLTINCINNLFDLNRLKLNSVLNFRKHNNYFNAPSVQIDQLLELITNDLIKEFYILAIKKQLSFKNRKNVL